MPKLSVNYFHPGLPSIEDAKNHHSIIRSDHLAFVVNIPYENQELITNREKICLLSWNVTQDELHGFAPPNQYNFNETIAERNSRFFYIAQSLKKFIELNHLDFITLQEISSHTESLLYKKIIDAIDDEYSPVIINNEIVDGYNTITFYNKKKFKFYLPANMSSAKDFRRSEYKGTETYFTRIDNENIKLKILNLNPSFKYLPLNHEALIGKLLKTNIQPIIIGSLNCGVAPLHNRPQNIITCVRAPIHTSNGFQGAYAADGCFYRELVGNSFIFKQAEIQTLDASNGDFYSNEVLQPIINNPFMCDAQKKEINSFRFIICSDNGFNQDKLINDQYTIFEYETYLQTKFNDPSIYVRWAKNLKNQDAIGIILNPALHVFLHAVNRNLSANCENRFQFYKSHPLDAEKFSAVFVNRQTIPDLIKVIAYLQKNPLLLELSQCIAALEKDNIESKFITGFKSLLASCIKENIDTVTIPNNIVIEHFIEKTNKLLTDKIFDIKTIQKSADELDRKLYGKPPLSQSLSTAAGTLIGILVGAAIGAAIGGAATAPAGGFGAIPGAIIGALSMGNIGCWTGLFNGNFSNTRYLNSKIEKDEQLNHRIKHAIKTVWIGFSVKPIQPKTLKPLEIEKNTYKINGLSKN